MKRIELRGKHGQGKFALVDDDDFDLVSTHVWRMGANGYPYARTFLTRQKSRRPYVQHYMHRLIMKPVVPLVVDHINGDPLDNRRSNLRVCTLRQNNCNGRPYNKSSKYKGVRYRYGRWYARITVNFVGHHLGSFATEEEAGRAYNRAAELHFGEYAQLNRVPE